MIKKLLFVGTVVALAGCSSTQNNTLIFAQSDTYGVSIGGGVSEQGADFTLGYKGIGVAIIPVINSEGELVASGSDCKGDVVNNNVVDTCKEKDTMSVFGTFESGADKEGNVTLGKFFSTGIASRSIAEGFKKKIGDSDGDD